MSLSREELKIEGLIGRVANLGREAPKNMNGPCFPDNSGLGFRNPLATQGVGVDHVVDSSPLRDISNALNTLANSTSIRTWKKLALEVRLPQEIPLCPTNLERRPLMELDEPQFVKKRCLRSGGDYEGKLSSGCWVPALLVPMSCISWNYHEVGTHKQLTN